MTVNTFGVNRSQFKLKLERAGTSEEETETEMFVSMKFYHILDVMLQQNDQNRERRVD